MISSTKLSFFKKQLKNKNRKKIKHRSKASKLRWQLSSLRISTGYSHNTELPASSLNHSTKTKTRHPTPTLQIFHPLAGFS